MNAPELSAIERQALRLQIDAHVRAAYANRDIPRCTGCNMPLDDLTPNCSQCWDRHRNRQRVQIWTERAAESERLFRIVRARFAGWGIEGMGRRRQHRARWSRSGVQA